MKREEAIECIRGFMGQLTEGCREALVTAIPELRESEDERIRRTLVEYFGPEVQLDFVRGVPIQKIRDWLEKRKEQKPAKKLPKKEYVKKFKALCDAYEIKIPNREYDIYHLCKDLHKLFGDVDAQKPVEWSEEDEQFKDGVAYRITLIGDIEQSDMKAQNKIYVPIVNLGIEEGEHPAPLWWNKDKKSEHTDVVGTIEYIREEAILEWAKKEEDKLDSGLCSDGFRLALTMLKQKLNSL